MCYRKEVMTKKVKVRVAVAVNQDGNWIAHGWDHTESEKAYYEMEAISEATMNLDYENGVRSYWLEAELEVPESEKVQADVVEVRNG